MYNLIRFLIVIVLLVSVVILIRKSKNKFKKAIILLAFIAFDVVLALVPIENSFILFSSPQQVAEYYTGEKAQGVVYGENTALVITTETSKIVFPKTDNGWKIANSYNTDLKYFDTISEGTLIAVLNFDGTDEWYVEIYSVVDSELNITDTSNSEFELIIPASENVKSGTYFAYVNGLDEDYEISVNGITWKIKTDS